MKLSPDFLQRTTRNTTIQSWSPEDLGETHFSNDQMVSSIAQIFSRVEDKTIEINESGRVARLNVEDPAKLLWEPLELERVVIKAIPALEPVQVVSLPVVEAVPQKPDLRESLLMTAQEEADGVVRKAQAQAAEILQLAQANADAIRMQAHQQGIDQGMAEVEQLTNAAKSVLEQASEWRSEMLEQCETIVIDMVQEIAKALFHDGFMLPEDQLQMTLSRIMSSTRTLGDLRIYLNSEDAVRLDPSWREFQVAISNQKIQIVGSDGIQPGGCFIDGLNGTVDARLETRLKMILDAIKDEGEQK
jgi:flagellar assembly protein FliH